MSLKLLTITVWKMQDGVRIKPQERIFENWDSFWGYIKDNKVEEAHTLVFSTLMWTLDKQLKQKTKVYKDMGFWHVDLYERN